MNNIIYHGSFTTNIKELQPCSKTNNTIKESVVYFTPNYFLALLYIWNKPYKFVTYSENDNNQVVFTEWFENQLYEFYHNTTGSIYSCDMNNSDIYKTHINNVYASKVSIPVVKEQLIPDVYSEILKQISLGNIILKKYQELSGIEKNDISLNVIRSIHMEHLLDQPLDNENSNKIIFIKDKFPKEWDIATKQSKNEIENMINEWKKSL